MRLPGLQHRRLPIARSPGKAFTPQPGEYAVTRYCCGFFPACAALSRATGPQIAGNPSAGIMANANPLPSADTLR
ncbi:hypothetical protein FML67_02335 [Klebsiella michiganensis]|nr:hypothetical protein [Klebsiella michiganensis]